MIGAALQRMISAKRVWRTTLKDHHEAIRRPPGDYRTGSGRPPGGCFSSKAHKCEGRCLHKEREASAKGKSFPFLVEAATARTSS